MPESLEPRRAPPPPPPIPPELTDPVGVGIRLGVRSRGPLQDDGGFCGVSDVILVVGAVALLVSLSKWFVLFSSVLLLRWCMEVGGWWEVSLLLGNSVGKKVSVSGLCFIG